jgi:hypothetical protein
MLQALVIFLLLLLGGPIIAYLILMGGCASPWYIFGLWCGHNAPITLAIISIVVWILIGVLLAIRSGRNTKQ